MPKGMTKLVTLTFLFLFIMYLKNALSLVSEIEGKRKEDDEKYSNLWFGPRIGRRKRNPNDETEITVNNDVQYLEDFIWKNHWVIVVLPAGKKLLFMPYHFFYFGSFSFQCYPLCRSI